MAIIQILDCSASQYMYLCLFCSVRHCLFHSTCIYALCYTCRPLDGRHRSRSLPHMHPRTRIYACFAALEIALFHGNDDNATDNGRVSVTKYGIQGKICAAHWNDAAANVVCTQLVSVTVYEYCVLYNSKLILQKYRTV